MHVFRVFNSNLFIVWNYNEFSTIFDALMEGSYFFGKIMFYFGFTFHIQSILDKPMPNSFKLWMITDVLIVIVLVILYVYEWYYIGS